MYNKYKEVIDYLNNNIWQEDKIYVVWWTIRDFLLDKDSKDFDIVWNMSSLDFKDIFGWAFSEKFWTVFTMFNDIEIEYTPLKWTLEEDSNRRDFTINSIFFDIMTHKYIDYNNWIEDIKNWIIRLVWDDDYNLIDDPLRILRAFRLKMKLGFDIENITYDYMIKHFLLLDKVWLTRIFEEFRLWINLNFWLYFNLLSEYLDYTDWNLKQINLTKECLHFLTTSLAKRIDNIYKNSNKLIDMSGYYFVLMLFFLSNKNYNIFLYINIWEIFIDAEKKGHINILSENVLKKIIKWLKDDIKSVTKIQTYYDNWEVNNIKLEIYKRLLKYRYSNRNKAIHYYTLLYLLINDNWIFSEDLLFIIIDSIHSYNAILEHEVKKYLNYDKFLKIEDYNKRQYMYDLVISI